MTQTLNNIFDENMLIFDNNYKELTTNLLMTLTKKMEK